MKFGINTFIFASPFTDKNIALFKDIKQMGFDGVEIALEKKEDLDYRGVLKALKENGLECCSICGAYGPGRDLRGTPEEQETSKQYIKDCIDACTELECDLFIGPHYSWVGRAELEPPEEKKSQWKTVVKNFKEVCEYASKKGVYIAVEPLNRFETDMINTCDRVLKMIDDVGSEMLKVHLDTFHMNIEEKSLPMAIIKAGEDLFHVHASENDRGAPGTGTVDWKGVKDALMKIGYSRWVVIESFTPEVKIIAKAASIWRETEKSGFDLARKGLSFLKGLFVV
ncbi:MAG: sugar phosphate isomerase/epimerase [Spirochaetota bacterium]|nr:MAG: sugar phosphate isomerase/epimerase [Spirochaetota bacterium]